MTDLDHTRPLPMASIPQHQPVTADVASLECWEQQCDDFFTDDRDEIPDTETCSHLRQMQICEACSTPPPGDADPFPPVVAWTDCLHKSVTYPAP